VLLNDVRAAISKFLHEVGCVERAKFMSDVLDHAMDETFWMVFQLRNLHPW
jgi:hypothetical protein